MIPEKFEFIKEMVNPKKGERILNIGIGIDPYIEREFENKCELWTADVDKGKIDNAKSQLKKTKVIFIDLEAPLNKSQLKGYFDKIILLEVLEHVCNDKKALRTINKLLKKDGELIISVPDDIPAQTINLLNWIVHYRHYTLKELTEKLQCSGFKIAEEEHVGNWIVNLNLFIFVVLRHIFRMKHLKSGEILFKKSYGKSFQRGRTHGMSIMLKARKIR